MTDHESVFWCAHCQTTCENACSCVKYEYDDLDIDHCPHCGSSEAPGVEYYPAKDVGYGIFHSHFQVVCSRIKGGCGSAGPYRELCIDAIFFWNLREILLGFEIPGGSTGPITKDYIEKLKKSMFAKGRQLGRTIFYYYPGLTGECDGQWSSIGEMCEHNIKIFGREVS